MNNDLNEWVAELLRRHGSGDNAGVVAMLEAERDRSPFYPDRIEIDGSGKAQFYCEVFLHPDRTFHAAPFQR